MSILQMNFSAACIIVAIIVIRAVALDKLPKRLFQLFWLIPIIRLFVPFSFQSSISIFNLFEQAPAQGMANVRLPAEYVVSPNIIPAAQTDTYTQTVSPYLVVWIVGIIALATYFIVVNVQSRKGFATSVPISSHYIADWLARHKLRRSISVRVSDRITAPLAYGVIKPVILLPVTLDFSDEERLNYILTHEFLHIKRLDILKSMALMATACVYWFNPLVWAMYILANRDIELACDEGVLRKLGINTNASYALTLIQMQESRRSIALANSLSRYAIKERIESIMKHKKKISIIAIVIALALVVSVTTALASSATPDVAGGAGQTEAALDAATSMPEISEKVDVKTGEKVYSDDNELTWMTQAEYEAKYPAPDYEYWTAEEYEKWIEQERVVLQGMIGEQGRNYKDGEFTWTQEKVDETIAMYEGFLQDIKNGQGIIKPQEGDDIAVGAAEAPSEPSTDKRGYSAVLTDGTNEKAFEDYESQEALLDAVKTYLDEQVSQGKMTQAEADKAYQAIQ